MTREREPLPPGGPPRVWRIDPEGIQLVAGSPDMRYEHPAVREARARALARIVERRTEAPRTAPIVRPTTPTQRATLVQRAWRMLRAPWRTRRPP